MTPDEFLRSLSQREPAPAYLFAGPETWSRERCRRALVERVLPEEERAEGFTRHDLDEVELSAVLDDARSLSLFASHRVIWASSAEAALPKRKSAAAGEDEESVGAGKHEGASGVTEYLKSPTPGVVLVFEASRYDFEGDDKARLQRVQKFYAPVPVHVEFPRFGSEQARRVAREIARERGLRIGETEIDLLVEALGTEAARIPVEIEKLALYAGSDRKITSEDIAQLVPSAKAATIFNLVNALGRNDRAASLESLDALIRDGEYLPLALSFLSTQFRLALAAKEAKLMSAGQIQAFFTKQGMAMWRSRAEQVAQTATAFPVAKLRAAVQGIHQTDRALRDTRPDDRTVMEKFVIGLTGN